MTTKSTRRYSAGSMTQPNTTPPRVWLSSLDMMSISHHRPEAWCSIHCEGAFNTPYISKVEVEAIFKARDEKLREIRVQLVRLDNPQTKEWRDSIKIEIYKLIDALLASSNDERGVK